MTEATFVDIAAVPDFVRRKLARAALDSLERTMAEPGAEERFQAWLVEYRKRRQEPPRGEVKQTGAATGQTAAQAATNYDRREIL